MMRGMRSSCIPDSGKAVRTVSYVSFLYMSLLIVCMAAILFFPAAQAAEAAESGSGQEASHVDSPVVDSRVRYDISVHIDPVERTLRGRSVITANTREELTLVIGRSNQAGTCLIPH